MPVTQISDIYTLQDAKDFVHYANTNSITLTESQLHQVIDKMDRTVAGSEVTLMYSKTYGDTNAWQIAEKIGADSGGKVATMGQTDLGKLLGHQPFIDAVRNTAGGTDAGLQSLMFGEDLSGNRINATSISDYGSTRFSSAITGKVQILSAPDANPDSIFSKSELNAMLANTGITEIDGIDRADIHARFQHYIEVDGLNADVANDNVAVLQLAA